MTRVRDIAKILSVTEDANTGNIALASIADGSNLSVYATLDDLPTTGLTSGDQAFITATSRLYVSNGSGWYNVALVNATPSLSIDPTGAITLATDGSTPTIITLTATDSDNAVAGLTYSVESDGSFARLGTISQDSSVFTITPLSEDSAIATTETSTLTFKASDGINFGSGTTTFTLSFVTIVANSAETAILLKADTAGTDNQVDASTNNHTITENGDVTSTAFTPYHPGGYSFDKTGSTSWLQLTTSGDLQAIGRSGTALTIEAWVYLKAAPQTYGTAVYSQGVQGSNNTGTNTISFEIQQDRTLRSLVNGQYNSVTNCPFSTGTVPLKEWTHIALVLHNNTWTHYINGVADGTATGSYPSGTVANTAYIGRIFYESLRYADMKISDLRITSTALYTSTFTPPTERLASTNDTLLLTCHLPYFTDGSSDNYTISAVGSSAVSERFGPYDYIGYAKANHGGSVYFDGTGDYFHMDLGANGGPDGDFTIEFWVYNQSGTTNSGFFHMSATAGGFSSNDSALALGKSTYYNFYYGTGGQATGSFSGGLGWQHFAMVRSGSTITIYHHGKVITTQSESGDFSSYRYIAIGGYYSTSYLHTGYIADFRYVKGTAVYTSAFTPPTAPLTAITNTQLLTCTNKNDIWEQGSGSLLTKVGNTTASNTQRQFTSSSAIYFDGTSAVENTIDAIGNGDFTFEGWFNNTADTAGNYQMVFDNRSTLSTGPMLFYYEVDDKLYPYLDGTAFTSNNAISQNTWYHWALVRNNNACTFYLNGTAQTSNAGTSITTNFTSTEFNIGRSSSVGSPANGDYFIGYQQDFRITKGLARYTSNFTPPTAEFEG
jgi:hypothetical protein